MRTALNGVLSEHLVAHYEGLRAHALARMLAAGWSGTLLVRQGMLAWSQAWPAVTAPLPLPASRRSAPTPVPGIDLGVVRILAGMVLAVQEVSDGD